MLCIFGRSGLVSYNEPLNLGVKQINGQGVRLSSRREPGYCTLQHLLKRNGSNLSIKSVFLIPRIYDPQMFQSKILNVDLKRRQDLADEIRYWKHKTILNLENLHIICRFSRAFKSYNNVSETYVIFCHLI